MRLMELAPILEQAQLVMAALRALPSEAHVAAVVGLVAGLVLWLMGARVVKPVLAVLGVLLGATIGFLLPPQLGIDRVASVPSPYIGAAVGAAAGLGVAIGLFRFAAAIAGGAVLAIAGLLIAGAYLQFAPRDEGPPDRAPVVEGEADLQGDELYLPGVDRDGALQPNQLTREQVEEAADVAGEQFEVLAERCREFVRRVGEALSAFIEQFPTHQRVVLAAGLVAGGIVGLLFGMVMPTKSAGLVTALLGSAVWLSNAGFLLQASPVGGGILTNRSPMTLMILWIAVGLIGVGVQWKWLGRPGKKKPSADEDE